MMIVVLYREGDFYRAYSSSAGFVSACLGITLTTLGGAMCGFPCAALSGYLVRLHEAGYGVLIVDGAEVVRYA